MGFELKLGSSNLGRSNMAGMGQALSFGSGRGGFGLREDAAQRADDHQGSFRAETATERKSTKYRDLAIFTAMAAGFIAVFVVSSGSPSESKSYTSPAMPHILAAIGFGLAVGAFFLWRRVWAVADTPVMEAAGLRPGMFEVEGTILPNGGGHLSWFTETECAYWEAKVERREQQGKNTKWVTRWSRTSGRKKFWLQDQSGHVRADLSTANSSSMRTLVTKTEGKWRYSERAYVVGEPLWVKAQVHADDHGLVVGQPEKPRFGSGSRGQAKAPRVLAAADEAKYIQKTRLIAMVMTIASAFLMATWTLWEPAISNHPDHMGAPSVAIRDGALLRPFMAIIAIAAVFWLISFFVRLYNRLVSLKNQSSAAWANIDVAALQRHDLIEGLVAATKGAAAHERQVLERVAAREALAMEQQATLPDSAHVAEVDQGLTNDAGARTVIARAEAMPELKTQANFQQLFQALVRIENRIAASRKYYNDAVMLLADRSKEVPGNLVAPSVIPHGAPPPLQFDPEIQQAPVVSVSQ